MKVKIILNNENVIVGTISRLNHNDTWVQCNSKNKKRIIPLTSIHVILVLDECQEIIERRVFENVVEKTL